MEVVEVKAILAGTQPMDAYGGTQLDRTVLEQMVEALRAGRLPLILQHDPTRPIAMRLIDTGIEKDGDGFEQVWIRFEVEKATWDSVQDEWARAGASASGGFSWSGSVPLTLIPEEPDATKPTVALAADAHFWTEDQILDAARRLSSHANVEVGQRFAFAHIPDPVVVATLYEMAKAVGAAGIWDALKTFLRRAPTADPLSSQETIFEFRVSEGGRETVGRVTTDDPDVLRHAIEALNRLNAPGGAASTWNDAANSWQSPPSLPPAPIERDQPPDVPTGNAGQNT